MHPHHYRRDDDAIVWKEGKIYIHESSAFSLHLDTTVGGGGEYSRQRVVGKKDKKKLASLNLLLSRRRRFCWPLHSRLLPCVYTRYYIVYYPDVGMDLILFPHVIGDAFWLSSLYMDDYYYYYFFFHLTLFIIFKSNTCLFVF